MHNYVEFLIEAWNCNCVILPTFFRNLYKSSHQHSVRKGKNGCTLSCELKISDSYIGAALRSYQPLASRLHMYMRNIVWKDIYECDISNCKRIKSLPHALLIPTWSFCGGHSKMMDRSSDCETLSRLEQNVRQQRSGQQTIWGLVVSFMQNTPCLWIRS